ncbi:nadh dehydrogenase ubiquinone 1 alpha subcomplex subunit 12 [Nannochloropsis gaditana]|uniref:NADH dehydrogenase [ubiquinone] 1 alpha subcomplex subunit 12 n=1 Tax=Nannochloropsis gaditana TaxID=72520 RepID=W7TFP2_9STRA|nr:nadh dehydrogenase ubiquinone 1 alpha subcomplex subunit 12 [Nannochloropsis gaditana]
MASVVQKYMKALRVYGWRETLYKMYSMGEVKFGDLKGVDVNGNKYFENVEYPFGQHRWVEYKDIHNYEPSSIPPEWHGWIHHMTDEVPAGKAGVTEPGMKIAEGQHTPYQVAAGLTDYQMEGQLNWTAHRSRGYGVGSLHQKAGEPDKFWVQPGHPLAAKKQEKGKGGRFEGLKGYEAWNPSDPEGKKTAQPIRSLDEN